MSKEKDIEQEAVQNEENIAAEQENEATESNATEATEEKDPIQVLEAQLLEEKNKYLRLYADFENFRRRTAKERIELIQSAGADIVKNLLPILDDFDRAIANNETIEDIKAVKEGFGLINNKFKRTLEQAGLKEMEDLKGKNFDVDHHEAITKFPAPSDDLKGKVIDVAEKGYFLNDKVVRFAKVVVGE